MASAPLSRQHAGRKGERSRQRLIDAAIVRFAAEGFRRTSVSDIARDADLTPAAAYAYFPNKEALFRRAVDEDAAALIDRATPDRGTSGSLAQRWMNVPGRLQALLPEHPLARRVLAGQEPDVIAQLLELPSLAELRSHLATDIAAAQADGDARPDINPEEIALGLETIVLSLLMAGAQVPDEARMQSALAVLAAALAPAAS